MGTGYTRADVSNNIADGNIINSADLDNEYDAIEAAFNSSTGHTHDGTAAEGGAITVVGPVQDLVVSATEVKPKTTNTLDLGTSALLYKDAYLQGNMYFRDTALKIVSSADGQLDIDADVELELVAPTVDIDASTALTVDTASTTFTSTLFNVTGSANITGDLDVDNININGNTIISTDTNGDINISPDGTGTVVIDTDLDVDNININGNTIISTDTNGNIALTPNGTGEVDISKVDIASGEIDGTTIGANSAAAGTFTTLSATTLGSAVDLNSQALTNANIDSGAIDGITLGTNSAVTEAQVDNININGNTISSTDTNGNITLAPNGTGVVDVTGTVTADGLTVEGTTGITISGAFPLINFGETDTTDENSRVRVSAGDFRIDTVDNSYANGKTRFLLDNATGDISFYDSTGTTQGLYWDASTERLGVGTTSPDLTLDVSHNVSSEYVATFQNTADNLELKIGTTSGLLNIQGANASTNAAYNIALNAEGGNVGIGTSSPSRQLEIYDDGTNGQAVLALTAQNTENSRIMFADPDDNNIGIIDYNHSDDSMRFSVNNSERLRIDSSGNVGIGTSSPVRTLHVNSGTGNNVALFESSDATGVVWLADGNSTSTAKVGIGAVTDDLLLYAGGSQRLRIDSSGNVGIGTTSSGARLDVKGATAFTSDANAYTGGVGIASKIITAGGTNDIGIQSQDVIQFATGGTTERMRIDSSGKVGIGTTTNTTHSLFIHDSDYQQLGLSGIRPTIWLKETDGNADENYQIRVDNGDLQFQTQNDTQTSAVSRLVLDSSGRVGIANGSPTATLHVGASGAAGTTEPLVIFEYSDVTAGSGDKILDLKFPDADPSSADFVRFLNSTSVIGSVRANSSSTVQYLTSSDYRLKENVVADWDATTRLKQLNPVRFNFIADADTTVDGFLAHEVQDIVPEAISGTKDAMRDEEYQVSAATGDIYTPAIEAVLDEDGNEVTPAVAEVIHSTDVAQPRGTSGRPAMA
jgi:hypothetical protein